MKGLFEGLGMVVVAIFCIIVAVIGNVVLGIAGGLDKFKLVVWVIYGVVTVITMFTGTFSPKDENRPLGFLVAGAGSLLNGVVVYYFLRECEITLADRMFSFVITLFFVGPIFLLISCGVLWATFAILERLE